MNARGYASHTEPPASPGIWHTVAFALMLAMTFTWAICAIGFLFGATIGRWQAACGLVLAALIVCAELPGARARWLSLSLLIGLLCAALLMSALTVDSGYDGWSYHQPGVIALSHGWNPVAQPVFANWWAPFGRAIGYPGNGPAIDNLWTSVYPKAFWILGAQAVAWGLPLDSGKYPGLILIYVVTLTALRALRLRGVPGAWAYALSLLAALNPICIVQATTFYIDGALGSCLAILIFSLLSYDLTRSRRDLVLALCAVLIACNLKYTGPVYTALIALPFGVWWLCKHRWAARELQICGIAALILLAGSVNPYFTNLKQYGSPIYPVNAWDLEENQMSAGFLEEPSLKRLLISLSFSNLADRPTGDPASDERNFSSPLQSRGLAEFKKFGSTADLRIGGFGPFFGLTLALALALALALLAACLLIRGPGGMTGFALVAAGTLLSIVVNPHMWWARFVPQMWLLPVLVAATAVARRSRVARPLALVMALLMSVTSLIAVIGRATSSYLVTQSYRHDFGSLGTTPLLVDTSNTESLFLPALTYRLHEQGSVFEVATGQCATPINFIVIRACKNVASSR
jgi:hypothetical protein